MARVGGVAEEHHERQGMDHSAGALTVTRAHGIAYRTPGGGNGKSKHSPRGNYLVKLEATTPDGRPLTGIGECQPRGGETGDRGAASWEFLLECLSALERRELSAANRDEALAAVRALMDELHDAALATVPERSGASSLRNTMRGWARQLAGKSGRRDHPRPFRGTLYGIETALLDLVASGLDISVAELLGVHTEKVAVAAPLSGRSGTENNLAILHEAAEGDTGSIDEPLWIDVRGSLSPPDAAELVRTVVRDVSLRKLPRQVIIEEPVRPRHRHHLTALQRKAAAAAAESGRPGVDVRIMAGESVWSRQGLERLIAKGGVGALNIRPAAVGGLLASIELAQAALTADPDVRIHLSQTEGASDVAAAALNNLAVALPQVHTVFTGDDEHQVTVPAGPGLGVGMPYAWMIDRINEYVTVPAQPEVAEAGPTPNVYDEVPYLQPLGPNGTKGHLLEREALALGLSTTRFSKGAFVATDNVHPPLMFKWSRSPLSTAVSLALCTHKEATRMRLRRSGVPVPRGRTFANGDYGSARAFAERVGYPVVVKPAMGVRGIGVVANIQNEQELDLAFRQLEDSKLGNQDFIVEQHVTGRDYRIVVVGDEVIAAILREPASVVGDGQHSIAELMVRKNLVRRLNPHLWGRPIKYDDAAKYQLQRVEMTLESVPEAGQRVLLSNSCSLSQGGDSIDVLDEMHPSIKDACVRAVKAVPGLAFCGVDFLLEDHTKPIDEQQAGICELNAHAAIGNCEYPLYGTPREVARTFIDECVERFQLVTNAERAETLALKLTIRGKVTRVGYRLWMKRRARSFGVNGWVRNVNDRTVEAVLVGPTAPTSALAAAAVLGSKDALPTSVTTVHVVPPQVEDFSIVDRAPQELVHVG
ncbi:enolase C-terminal domain-like protein [Phytoactinopolyspora halotolerans]|uniref:acylphosphatase n=1 Tax=Phytoactinopolyspora halotolerans TaxID=1981512 RepID=A0A6L9SG36_9ACTN|nr:enolase C-terminal domain-like protein [Phytoactinopolyspora halotolerans]NEE04093.1 ATP-grasp domain-containing protein [Phytoactinopolyspora halotolerans]